MNDVDYSQRTAEDLTDDDYSLIRYLRNITALRYAPFLNDPVLAKRFLLGNTVVEEEAQKPGESTNTSPEQDALLLQDRARGQRFTTDKRIGSVAPGESQPDSEPAARRRKQMSTDSDLEFLENPQAWNQSRKL